MRRALAVAGAIVALATSACGGDEGAATRGVVSTVVDGDTIDVAGVGRVRLIGIDTPERGECGFQLASDRLAELVLGAEVALVPGAQDDADRYDRLLRYVDVGGTDAGLALVESGLAVSRYDSRDGYGTHDREEAYVLADERVVGIVGCPTG